jgi:hypothetical protein
MTTEGQFSFRYWVDSEQGYDTLQFLVDDQPLLVAGGQTGWQTFSTMLPAGQRQLVWRFSKDSTLSSGQDAAWIDDVRIEQASLALWQPADTRPVSSTSNAVQWRVPNSASADAGLRVRARLGAASSPWITSAPFTIDEPTAVSLGSFEAGMAQTLGGQAPLLVAGLSAVLGATLMAAGWRRKNLRRD